LNHLLPKNAHGNDSSAFTLRRFAYRDRAASRFPHARRLWRRLLPRGEKTGYAWKKSLANLEKAGVST
jgi:hypothetical protein